MKTIWLIINTFFFKFSNFFFFLFILFIRWKKYFKVSVIGLPAFKISAFSYWRVISVCRWVSWPFTCCERRVHLIEGRGRWRNYCFRILQKMFKLSNVSTHTHIRHINIIQYLWYLFKTFLFVIWIYWKYFIFSYQMLYYHVYNVCIYKIK